MIPAIHFHYMKNEETAKRLFGAGEPFIASFVSDLADRDLRTAEGEIIYGRIHSEEEFYQDWALKLFNKNKDNPNVFWAQQGYRHCCGRCFNRMQENIKAGKGAFPDPYHEHVCLDGHSQSLEENVRVIRNGRDIMRGIGIEPLIYRPPNDLRDNNTDSALRILGYKYVLARNGFDYLLPGAIELPAYSDNGLIVLPESKVKKTKSPVFMMYYFDIVEDKALKWLELLQSSESLTEIPVRIKPETKVWINERIFVIGSKKLRDFKERAKHFF
jgi:hypothetical protein